MRTGKSVYLSGKQRTMILSALGLYEVALAAACYEGVIPAEPLGHGPSRVALERRWIEELRKKVRR